MIRTRTNRATFQWSWRFIQLPHGGATGHWEGTLWPWWPGGGGGGRQEHWVHGDQEEEVGGGRRRQEPVSWDGGIPGEQVTAWPGRRRDWPVDVAGAVVMVSIQEDGMSERGEVAIRLRPSSCVRPCYPQPAVKQHRVNHNLQSHNTGINTTCSQTTQG